MGLRARKGYIGVKQDHTAVEDQEKEEVEPQQFTLIKKQGMQISSLCTDIKKKIRPSPPYSPAQWGSNSAEGAV